MDAGFADVFGVTDSGLLVAVDACAKVVGFFAAFVAHPVIGMQKMVPNIRARVTSSVFIKGRVGQNTVSCQKILQ